VVVAIPKPRTTAYLQHDDEALRVKTHVVECLTEYVKLARQRAKPSSAAPGVDVAMSTGHTAGGSEVARYLRSET